MIRFPAWVVLTSVQYREIFRRDIYDISISVLKIRDMDTISRYIVRSCDIAWYGKPGMISRYIAIYHAISHRITPKQQANNPATSLRSAVYFGSVFAFLACLSSVLPFFDVLLLSISGSDHRTDRTTTKQKQQPCPLKAWPAPWARICFVISFVCVFFPLFVYFPVFFALLVPLVANRTYIRGS